MKENFDVNEAVEVVKPYFSLIRDVQEKSFLNTIAVKDMLIEGGIPITLKPRAKGCLMSECIKSHLEIALANDTNAKVVEINDIPGLLIAGRVLIRFNKMDDKFHTSIQKRKGYWKFVNQGEQLEGLPEEVVRMWAAFTPVDKQWSAIARYSLLCFDAGMIVWFNNLTSDYSVEQLTIPLQPIEKRRTKVKEMNKDQETKTGTDNK